MFKYSENVQFSSNVKTIRTQAQGLDEKPLNSMEIPKCYPDRHIWY